MYNGRLAPPWFPRLIHYPCWGTERHFKAPIRKSDRLEFESQHCLTTLLWANYFTTMSCSLPHVKRKWWNGCLQTCCSDWRRGTEKYGGPGEDARNGCRPFAMRTLLFGRDKIRWQRMLAKPQAGAKSESGTIRRHPRRNPLPGLCCWRMNSLSPRSPSTKARNHFSCAFPSTCPALFQQMH